MNLVAGGDTAEYVYTARRNNSLSTSGRQFVFGFILTVSLGIAVAFSLVFGAWPIMPFAGIEMAVLYLAFRYIDRHADDYERVTIRGDQVAVEVREGSRLTHHELNRCWAQVVCDGAQLALRSHGRDVEVGRHLSGERRVEMARELRRGLKALPGFVNTVQERTEPDLYKGEESMIRKSVSALTAGLFPAAMVPAAAAAEPPSQYNLQPPVSIIAEQIYDLHTLIMWIIVGIFVLVFGVMAVAIVKHRKSVGHQAEQFHENTTVEIIWTVVPFIILIGMAYPATKTVIAMKDTSNPDLTIKATGYQWKWGYDYLQEGVSFYSSLSTPRDQIDGGNNEARNKNPHYLLEVDNPVVVPVGKKVRIITTANDVIHAWWVPALGIKQDSIPGFVRDTWFKADKVGTYRGQCAELCGKDHGFMPIVVEVVEEARYKEWLASAKQKMATATAATAAAAAPDKQWTLEELHAQGAKVFGANCVACHQGTGMGIPGTFPALAGSKMVNGPKEQQINLVLNGKPGTAMAPFKHLSDAEIAAVVTYTRNNWTNKTGDMATPAEVKALRK